MVRMTTTPRPELQERRRTRIVATVGPVSRDPAVLEKLIQAGVDVFRLNLSHGVHADHACAFQTIHDLSSRLNQPVAVLADLCGPKIRVGRLAGGQIDLVTGQTVTITTRQVIGDAGLIPSQYPALARDVRPGDRILLDDGHLELRVERRDEIEAICSVVQGGALKERKGMNLPNIPVSTAALTDKDREDACFALGLGVDFLALSFVRRPEDIADLRALIQAQGQTTPIIAKIEKPEALDAIDEILELSDGIMVARGDLGVELAAEKVPIVQQQIVAWARKKCRPVIVATQMLESMVQNPRPTRAEVSDVSTAVFSGADAVMLSAETASGAFPVKAVQMMDRVARQVEGWQSVEGSFGSLTEEEREQGGTLSLRHAVARSTAQLSRDLKVKAVVVRSRGGVSATVVSATRPAAPVVAMTTDPMVSRRLNLLWGVVPVVIEPGEFDNPRPAARQLVQQLGLAHPGDNILLVAGFGKNEPTVTVLTV
jgi:pyruvate kinase